MASKFFKELVVKPAWKALTSKKSPTITSFGIKKDLKGRRKTFEEMRNTVDKVYKKAGVKIGEAGNKAKRKAIIKGSQIHDKYDKSVTARKKADTKLKRKAIGGASAAVVGTVGAHVGAKKKFPKYKKFMESDIKTVDGKLKIVPKKKK